MNRERRFAAAVVVGLVALIASYYLFGGPLHLSLYFPVTQTVETKPNHMPLVTLPTFPPLAGSEPRPTITPTKRPHPSMLVPMRTEILLHTSPRPISLSPTQAPVTPPPAPSYQSVTPPPYGQTMPPVIVPQAGIPLPGAVSPSPSSSP